MLASQLSFSRIALRNRSNQVLGPVGNASMQLNPHEQISKEGKVMKNVILAIVVAVFVSGRAVGNKYRFAETREDINVAGQKSIAVASVDKRHTVVVGESPPEYVGMQRGGFGNPFNVTTESDLPFADAVSKSISLTLVIVITVPVPQIIVVTVPVPLIFIAVL